MKTQMKYSLSDKDILCLTLYLSVPDIAKRFEHMGICPRQIYRVLERYNVEPPLKRRKKFFEDTVNATKLTVGMSVAQKKKNCREAIAILGQELISSIEKRAVAFEEKWN